MTTPTWHSDAYGLYNLHIGGEHWWIAPRQQYCDRGHWELGVMGASGLHPHHPSRYLHRLDSAIAEVERWHHRGNGRTLATSTMDDAFDALAPAEQAHWAAIGATFRRSERGLALTLTEQPTPQGPVWVMAAEGIDSLDDADGFPRCYLDPVLAFDEAACFTAWRLDKQPTEVPQRITRPPQAMGGVSAVKQGPRRARPRVR